MPRPSRPKRHLATEIALAIRNGAYRPGEWLRLIDLEAQFDAKRFDLRAALTELALRQTLEHVPNRGFRVAVPDWQRHRDMLLVRVLLEVEAAVTALPQIDAAALALLEAKADAFDLAVEAGSTTSQSTTNLDFHDTLYRFGPNQSLVEMVVETRDRARLWPMVLWPSVSALRRSAEGHRLILVTLHRRDAAGLAESVRAHILGSAANDPTLDEQPVAGSLIPESKA
jgi:DNA-binding GntR family transcriptional regulator